MRFEHAAIAFFAFQLIGTAVCNLTTSAPRRPKEQAPLEPIVRPTRCESIPIKLTREQSGCYTTPIMVNGAKLIGLIDTGASHVCMPRTTAETLELRGPIRTERAALANGQGITQRIYLADTVRFGGSVLNDVEVAVFRGNFPHVLIGQSVMARLSYAIDAQACTMTITGEVR